MSAAPHPPAPAAGPDIDPEVAARRDELVAWLDEHTNYERSMPTRLGVPTLERIRALCDLMGDPQHAYRVIHLTGTNGKGSTARILTELLTAQGLSVGTYTSPDVTSVNERLQRGGVPVDDADLAEVLGALVDLEPLVEGRLTRFELLTAAAFRWFADVAVDVAVVEVGLGGRWDATNVVQPEVAVVTNVSDDHVEVLGPELTDIAGEKAGIIKPGCRLVLGETSPELVAVFRQAADAAGVAELWQRQVEFGCDANTVAVGGRLLTVRTPGSRYEDLYLPLHGAHQGDNAALAVAGAEAFFGAPLASEVVEAALGAVRIPARLEVLGHTPLVVVDGAHNPAGVQALARALTEDFRVEGAVVGVVGMLHGRDPQTLLRTLRGAGVRTVVVCTAPSPRALPAGQLADAAAAAGMEARTAASPADAVRLARLLVPDDGMLVVAGSLYVAAEVRALLRGDELDGRHRAR